MLKWNLEAKSAKMKKSHEIAAHLIIFITWITLLISIVKDYNEGVNWRVSIWIALFFLSAGLYFYFKEHSIWTHLMVSAMILTAIFGELYIELYYTFTYYDKLLHFIVPILIVFVSYDFLRKFTPDGKKRLYAAILITVAAVLFWEVAEIVFDYFFDATLVGVFTKVPITDELIANRIEILNPWLDTVYDVILDFLGISIATVILKKSKE